VCQLQENSSVGGVLEYTGVGYVRIRTFKSLVCARIFKYVVYIHWVGILGLGVEFVRLFKCLESTKICRCRLCAGQNIQVCGKIKALTFPKQGIYEYTVCCVRKFKYSLYLKWAIYCVLVCKLQENSSVGGRTRMCRCRVCTHENIQKLGVC
jgi:hypothetical protein